MPSLRSSPPDRLLDDLIGRLHTPAFERFNPSILCIPSDPRQYYGQIREVQSGSFNEFGVRITRVRFEYWNNHDWVPLPPDGRVPDPPAGTMQISPNHPEGGVMMWDGSAWQLVEPSIVTEEQQCPLRAIWLDGEMIWIDDELPPDHPNCRSVRD